MSIGRSLNIKSGFLVATVAIITLILTVSVGIAPYNSVQLQAPTDIGNETDNDTTTGGVTDGTAEEAMINETDQTDQNDTTGGATTTTNETEETTTATTTMDTFSTEFSIATVIFPLEEESIDIRTPTAEEMNQTATTAIEENETEDVDEAGDTDVTDEEDMGNETVENETGTIVAQGINETEVNETEVNETENQTTDETTDGEIEDVTDEEQAVTQTTEDEEAEIPYIVSGSGNLAVNGGQVTEFNATFDMVHTDGTERHSHELTNFQQRSGATLDQDGDTVIFGVVDVMTNGELAWSGVDTIVTINEMNAVGISLSPTDTMNHFEAQRILGVVGSLTDETGNELVAETTTSGNAAVDTGTTTGGADTTGGTGMNETTDGGTTTAGTDTGVDNATAGENETGSPGFFESIALAISNFFGGGAQQETTGTETTAEETTTAETNATTETETTGATQTETTGETAGATQTETTKTGGTQTATQPSQTASPY